MLLCAEEEREYTQNRIYNRGVETSKKKSTIINCWKKAGIIDFRFSLTEKKTDEHTALSNIDGIKEKAQINISRLLNKT